MGNIEAMAVVSPWNFCGLNRARQRRKEYRSGIISGIFRRDSIQPYRFPLSYCYTPEFPDTWRYIKLLYFIQPRRR